MKFLWLALGGGAAASLFFLTKKAKAAESSAMPTITYGETKKVALAVPAGWRRATNTEVTAVPDLVTSAKTLRNAPGFTSMTYGTLTPFTASDGKTYATWIEQHFHEPGGSMKPWGLHHGVTLLAEIEPVTLSDEWPGVQ